jgi:hypothetical protein
MRISMAFLVLAVASLPLLAAQPPADDWIYLDNDQVRLGVMKSSGAAIAYFAESASQKNLLNHFDRGRLVQQSYYGDKDGSLWNTKPWRWNPVQGGDWKGKGARVLEIRQDRTTLYAKTLPRHWASGEELPEVTMEQWITLAGKVAHVRYKMTYTGQKSHPKTHQEIPAFFVEPELGTLVLYDGDKPWTGAPVKRLQPGWPNEGHKITENWAAYVDDEDHGVGAYVPAAKEITCYRYRGGGGSDCSYFAPLATLAITPGFVFEYDLYMTVGSNDEIRQAFRRLHDDKAAR